MCTAHTKSSKIYKKFENLTIWLHFPFENSKSILVYKGTGIGIIVLKLANVFERWMHFVCTSFWMNTNVLFICIQYTTSKSSRRTLTIYYQESYGMRFQFEHNIFQSATRQWLYHLLKSKYRLNLKKNKRLCTPFII